MSRIKFVCPALFIGMLIAFSGCLVDKGELVPEIICDSQNAETITYVDTMKTLIDIYCANSSGCHGTLSSNGDFTTYAGMQSFGVLDPLGVGARVVSPDPVLLMPLGNPLPA